MIDYNYEWVWHMISVNSIPFDSIRFDCIKEGFERTVPAVVIVVVVVVLLLLLHICYQLIIQVVAEASPAASSDR